MKSDAPRSRWLALVAAMVLLAAMAGRSSADDAASTDPLNSIRAEIKAGHYADAEKEARARLAEAEAASGPESLEAAIIEDLIVESRWRAGATKDPETLVLAERAVRIKELRRPRSKELVNSLNNLANVLVNTGDLAGARTVVRKCIELRKELYGPESAEVAKGMSNLGVIEWKQGNYEVARGLAERSLAILEKQLGSDDPFLVDALNNLSNYLQNTGEYPESLRLNERAEALARKVYGSDHPRVATLVSNRGITLRLIGDYAGARRAYEQSLAMKEKALGPDSPSVAMTLANLGSLLVIIGDDVAARPILERAVAIEERARGGDAVDLQGPLAALGQLFTDTGDYEQARAVYERCLAIFEKAFGPGHHDSAKILAGLGALRSLQGDAAGGEPLVRQALEIERASHGPIHDHVADMLEGLGDIKVDEADDAGAEPLYKEALSMREGIYGARHVRYAKTLGSLAAVSLRLGRLDIALKNSLRVEVIAREQFEATARGLSEREALVYEAARSSGLDIALSVLAARGGRSGPWSREAVWNEIVRSRAMVLDEMAGRHRVPRQRPGGDLAALEDALASSRSRLARIVVRGPDPDKTAEYHDALQRAQHEEESAERALAEKSAGYRQERIQGRIGLAEVRKALPPGAALASVVQYGQIERAAAPASKHPIPSTRSYVAFILASPGAPVEMVPLGSAASIDTLIEQWKREAATAPAGLPLAGEPEEARYRRIGEDLRRLVWDPIARRIGSARRLFVVPDGAISLLSLASLPTGPDRYLIETGPVLHYLSAERDIAHGGTAHARGRGLLAMGGPDYDHIPGAAPRIADAGSTGAEGAAESQVYRGARAACGGFRSLRFEPLPSAGIEVADVADLWDRARGGAASKALVLTGPAAQEEDFKRNAPGHLVLHLATHAFFVGGDCSSSLETAHGGGAGAAASDPFRHVGGENPLLLSGLALAGANRREEVIVGDTEDGVLTAEEIASLDLSGVEWAVLSACETGGGQVRAGEGVFGLRRAFETAGVGTLIMSLWSVEDSAAREWMRRLYEGRLRRMSTADAVRGASLGLLADRRRAGQSTHPFYWGAFVAEGDWR